MSKLMQSRRVPDASKSPSGSSDVHSQSSSGPTSQPRLSVWAALGNALLTLLGIYRY